MQTRNFTAINIEELTYGRFVNWREQDKFSFGEEIVLVRPMVLMDIVEEKMDHEDPDAEEFNDLEPLFHELKALEKADVLVCFDCQCNY